MFYLWCCIKQYDWLDVLCTAKFPNVYNENPIIKAREIGYLLPSTYAVAHSFNLGGAAVSIFKFLNAYKIEGRSL